MQILFLILKEDITTSESVYDCKEKNNLLCWNMHTYETRKVTYEKSTSRGNRNRLAICESRKERCIERKSITLYSKSLPVATETGVVISYRLIVCVTLRVQPRKMLM